MKKKELAQKIEDVEQGVFTSNVRFGRRLDDLASNLVDVFNSLKEIVDKHKDSTEDVLEALQDELDSYNNRMGPDQAEFNRYKTAVAKMFERKALELRGLFDKHDSSMIAKLNAFNGMQDQFTGFEKFITDKFNQLAAQLTQNTESIAAVQDELHSVRELWRHRTSVEILQQENKNLKEQLSNLSENFDCLNNTVNEIMKREAIRDRGVKIPCPSTDEYDELMESEELYHLPKKFPEHYRQEPWDPLEGLIVAEDEDEGPKQSRPSVEIVVATDCNGVIGVDGKIPWNCPEDLKLFKELTEGHVVVMGRKTYESLPKCFHENGLPNRLNIVMTKGCKYLNNSDLIFTLTDPQDIIDYVISETEGMKIFIIGGEEIYKLWMPYVDVIHHSLIATDINTELAQTVAKFEFVDADWGCAVFEHRKGFTYSKLIAMPGAKK